MQHAVVEIQRASSWIKSTNAHSYLGIRLCFWPCNLSQPIFSKSKKKKKRPCIYVYRGFVVFSVSMEEFDLKKSQRRLKHNTNKTLRRKDGKRNEREAVADKERGKQWVTVTSRRGKKERKKAVPHVPANMEVDKKRTVFASINQPRKREFFTGVPSARQNRKEFILRQELQPQNPGKVVYVSRFNHRKEKALQRHSGNR